MISKRVNVLIGVMVVALFITAVFLEENKLIPWKNYDYKFLPECDDVNTEITKTYRDHGFVLLNDSIMIWGGNELIFSSSKQAEEELRERMFDVYGPSNNRPRFYFLETPFQLIKRGKENRFTVIESGDTLVFELVNDTRK